jgi:hypothetical protein
MSDEVLARRAEQVPARHRGPSAWMPDPPSIVRPLRQARAHGSRWKRRPSTTWLLFPLCRGPADRRVPGALPGFATLAWHLD